jgi:acid phosphatase (class A)
MQSRQNDQSCDVRVCPCDHQGEAKALGRAAAAGRCLFACFLLLLSGTNGVSAREASAAPEISLTAVLGEPPAPHSPQDEADRAAVIAAVASRSPERQQQAVLDAEATIARFLEGMDVHLPKKSAHYARKFFARTQDQLEEGLKPAKDMFHRPRPFVDNPGLQPCEPEPRSKGSFPSSHAGTGTLFALLLDEEFPKLKDTLERRGEDFGYSRVVCGFHYPSDVEAGRKAGKALADALLADPKFRRHLDRATSEIRDVIGQ